MNILLTHPRLVICVPCYNEAAYLEQTLQSVVDQDADDFAVLVCDNASSDTTGEIARSFCDRDNRFHYYRQPKNVGAISNFTFARHSTESPYILRLGGHDVLAPDCISYHMRTLDRRPEVSVSLSTHVWIDEHGKRMWVVKDGDQENDSPFRRYIAAVGGNSHNTAANSVIRRSALHGYELAPVVGTDKIMASHLAFHGKCSNTDDVLYKRRCFSERAHNNAYMQRVTGVAGLTEDWNALGRQYEANLRSLVGANKLAVLTLRTILRYYYPVWLGSMTTKALWTIRRSIKLATGRSGISQSKVIG